jgi:hypothetical protein
MRNDSAPSRPPAPPAEPAPATLRRVLPAGLVAAALLGISTPASAKDLGGRFGVGFNSSLGEGSALSARFGVPTGDSPVNVIIEGIGGFDTLEGESTEITAGGRLLVSTVVEDNMNLYVGGGAGYVFGPTGETVRLQPLAAIDFFFFGLDNLGFTTAFGLNIDVGGNSSGVGTTSTAQAGVTYWF